MIEIYRTSAYLKWIRGMTDRAARARIEVRLSRLETGLFGDVKSVGEGVSELRIDYGPGYRVYFTRHGEKLVLLLMGGDKRTQARDIRKAQELAREMEDMALWEKEKK